jgi:hypothetical protein
MVVGIQAVAAHRSFTILGILVQMPSPPRRRFQFSLSTVLILIAIVAWVLATRPYTVARTQLRFTPRGESPRVISIFAGQYGDPGSDEWLQASAKIPQPSPGGYEIASRNLPNPRLIWPGIALVGLIAWKAGWAMAARRRARRESTP